MNIDIKKNLDSLHIPEDVSLIAVSKTKPTEMIKQAYSYGQRDFGENYINEAIEKIKAFKEQGYDDIRWHLIGHLQSNKAKLAAQYFDMVQSIDSEKTARKLDSGCKDLQKMMPVLVQINIGREEQKSGIYPENTDDFLKRFKELENLDLKGFMCIPPFHTDPDPYFEKMKTIFDRYKDQYDLSILSMGMSSDYLRAIEQGSNMVRIGTKIFGSR